MEPEILKKLEVQGERIEQIYVSVEKSRKYFMWTLIISIVVIVLPLIVMIFMLPNIFSMYSEALNY